MPAKRYRSQTWIDPRQVFSPSRTQGIGSFAREIIRRGEIVEIVGGTVMTDAEFQAFARATPRFNAIQIDEDRHLVEVPEITQRRAGGSLNHSCDSNLWLADEVTLIARRDIAPGEEITVDYALFTAEPEWILEQSCRCGSEVCRHTITGDDWQRLDVQQRYYPHFSPFINVRIERLRHEQSGKLD
ncbi:MAG TPA: SET domain-containing protein-lysine N-methyltransferase [Herpetosiphonaceae bacterium]